MKKIVMSLLALASLLFGSQAFAHVSYRDLSVLSPFQRSVTSNVGWADAAEADWGDSHHGAFFSFTLAADQQVKIDVTGLGQGTYANLTAAGLPNASTPTYSTVAALTDVGFSLYKGLLPASTYEGATNSATGELWIDFAAQGKQGGWNANGDMTMYNNSGQSGTLEFLQAVNNSLTNAETLTIFLTAGSYTITAGGAIDPASGAHSGTYAIQASMAPVPVPGAVWLFGSAMAGLIGFGRRKAVVAA